MSLIKLLKLIIVNVETEFFRFYCNLINVNYDLLYYLLYFMLRHLKCYIFIFYLKN